MNLYMFKNLMSLFIITVLVACGGSSKNPSTPNTPPGAVSLSAVVTTDSSGIVNFTASATNAVSYDFDFGNGVIQTIPSGITTYKYTSSGTYTVNVIAKSAAGLTSSANIQITVAVKLNLVWSDEFNTPGSPDPTKWTYDLGAGGWGNNELEYYTSRTDNAIVSNGTLKIIAKKESYSGSNYTSARLKTQGLYSFKYGRIDVSAKLPASIGTWPAIWMLGNNISTAGWPACGEIDIMEQNGNNKNIIYGTLHYPAQVNQYGDGSTTSITNAATTFHKYSAIWSPTTIQLLVDDVVYYTLPNKSSFPFNQNFFIILNIAIGGTLGGTVDPSFTTDQMEIDYVRVYQ
jgi:beta-glucanase (GH16 family)